MSRLILDEHIDYLEFMAKCNKENKRFVEAVNETVKFMRDMESKLAHYEDLEEQGRLIELRCAVGDTVWAYWIDGKNSAVYDYQPANEPACILVKDLWGTKFFATKEEAEAKLAELKGTEE